MADLTINPANVVAGARVATAVGIAGETVVAGQAGYRASVSGKWMKAFAAAGTSEARRAQGVFLNNASVDQPVVVGREGDITLGAVLTPGMPYHLSDATAGGIAPLADIEPGPDFCLLGLAKSASVLGLNIQSGEIDDGSIDAGMLDFSNPANSAFMGAF